MSRASTRHADALDEFFVLISSLLLASLGAGLILAIAGVLVPVTFFAATVPLTGALWWYVRRPSGISLRVGAGGKQVRWWISVLGILIVSGVTFLNVTSSAEHLQTNRDPGVYVTTGKWLATNGTLLIDGTTQGFDGFDEVSGRSGGYFDSRDDGLLYAQFNHGFPVLLAVSNWVGGDRLMFNLNPLIGAAFLLSLFVLLARLFRDWIALVATAMAAANLVFLHFTRDTYSEPVVALLLVLALIAIDRALATGAVQHWIFAGALVGSTALVRIDAWFYIAIFSGIIAIQSQLRRDECASPRRAREAVLTLLAAWIVGLVGYADLVLRSPVYLEDLWERARPMLWAAVMSGLLALTIIGIGRVAPVIVDRLRGVWHRAEHMLRWIGAAVVVGFFVWAMFWRPIYGIATGTHPSLVTGLMEREGIPADPTRSFSELSARWLSWYWGLPALIVAVLGWALAIGRRALPGRSRLYIPLLLMGLAIVPYIITPSITPDQLWALRRFFPMAIIGISVAVATGLMVAVEWIRRWNRTWIEPVFAAVAVLMLVMVPGVYAKPLATASTQVGMYGSTIRLCQELPENSAVLVEAGRLSTVFPAAIRSFCGVPVASLTPEAERADIDAVAAAWQERGRSLYVVGGSNACFVDREPVASSRFAYEYPERTLTYRPSQVRTESFGWVLGRWDGQRDRDDRRTAWEMTVRTSWSPPDSSSFIASEGEVPGARWWLEYRPTGIVEFWVTTESGPVGVAYPIPLNNGRSRTVPFGFDDEIIYIGCGANWRTAPARDIVARSGSLRIGGVHDGAFGSSEFIGEVDVQIVGAG